MTERWKLNLRKLKPSDAALIDVEGRIRKYDECCEVNGQLTDLIASGVECFDNGTGVRVHNLPQKHPKHQDEDKVRSTLRQYVRDWADEGQAERDECYAPLLERLKELYPTREARQEARVLVPGSGLCRLLFEVCNLGFDSQGNEFSIHMLLASYIVLNQITETYSVAVHPYLHTPCNHFALEDQFKEIRIPNVIPNNTLAPDSKFSMAAGEFLEVYGNQKEEWDVFCSCFFLDTAKNIFDYIRCIHYILKPGGYLINIGPLLFHYSDSEDEPSVEVSYEELRSILEGLGFEIQHEERKTCHYAGNPNSMIRTVYNTVFFTAVKL